MDYSIDDFIGVFRKVVPTQLCIKMMEHYKMVEEMGFTHHRSDYEDGPPLINKDNEVYALNPNGNTSEQTVVCNIDNDFIQAFAAIALECFSIYRKKFGVLEGIAPLGFQSQFKMQKTKPGEGYHVWHCEAESTTSSNRAFLVLLYLNDVAEGGETEFLYQHRRIAPEQGTMLICPGTFTHTHRGNPPLKGTKYIMNTWLEYMG